ncbi:hypothetical protein ES705_39604 [subsurface metagenome]
MTGRKNSINNIKLKSLEKTRDFYLWELKREKSLTERERSKYLLALKVIRGIIKKKEKERILQNGGREIKQASKMDFS